MQESVKDKLEKVYRLVNQGSTDGERKAAKLALDRLMEKYAVDPSILESLEYKDYRFRYATDLDRKILSRVLHVMVPPENLKDCYINKTTRTIRTSLKYMDWITVECAYEYFKAHCRKEYKRLVLPELANLRKEKTKRKRRKWLTNVFFERYIIASKLYREEELSREVLTIKSRKKYEDMVKMAEVEGGQYNKQIIGNKLLSDGSAQL